jgi:hypothetical protein
MKVGQTILLAASMLVGCVSVDLKSAATKDVGSKKSMEFSQNSYTKKWCGHSPQDVLDLQLQPSADAEINEAGLYRVVVSQTPCQILQGIVWLGFRTPVYVTWWLEK